MIFHTHIFIKNIVYRWWGSICSTVILKVLLLLFFMLNLSSLTHAQRPGQNIRKMNKMMDELYYDESDTSRLSNQQKGILPIPIIVTEPALGGFGGGVALGYLHSNKRSLRKDTPANVTGIFGGMTMNKSWLYGVAHSGTILNDHIRYTGGLMDSRVNIAFYREFLSVTIPLKVRMDIWGTAHKLLFRLGETDLFLGPRYIFSKTVSHPDISTDNPGLDSLINSITGKSKLGLLGLVFSFKNVKNTFSPDKGFDVGIYIDYNATFFGGDENFLKTETYAKYYFEPVSKIYGAIRLEGQFIESNAPFYAIPYVDLRGVPAMRYQGENVILAETQWRWAFYKDLSVLGFVGGAKAMNNFSNFKDAEWIYNYGGGVRFALKKLFRIRLGIDTAWSNEDFAWYISVGSSF
ncbi:BamA/TamA family outer membrane protein [Maribellus sediminis]|uniref:BamA/TamA family outer membrane protein n=1 Tax=Maribellus sediminis TaxID=2696285 RepID=UPI00143010C9|nr:BamA/TamA family outer membrane protein [Maribellus sediminis]